MLLKYIDVKSKIFYYLQVHSINLKYKKKPIVRSFKRTFRQVGPSYSAVEPGLVFTLLKLQGLTSHLASAIAENGFKYHTRDQSFSSKSARFSSTGFYFVKSYSKQFRALDFFLCNLVAFPQQAVIHLLRDYTVVFVFWMVCNKLSHPSSSCHQFS